MLRYFVIFNALCIFFSASMQVVNPGPKYPPTKGEVWPKPQVEKKGNTYYNFNPTNFKIKITDQTCDILTQTVQRYMTVLSHYSVGHRRLRRRSRRGGHQTTSSRVHDENYLGFLHELKVELTQPCEEYPYLGMDETYSLLVTATSKLRSASIWGIMRGLETFSHLLYLTNDFSEIRINGTEINDYPRYKHRGLLLDTSRHYISVHNILRTLDAMTINKMNVFHWHIVDDQSFPYESKKFPDLSKRGAYHPLLVYSQEDIKTVINYARYRGIRVLPEFDVPGHTRSWGVAYPNILTECYHGNEVVGLGPLNPINNATYKLLRDLFHEVQTVFPDTYFHIGGDEVEFDCWASNPELLDYMLQHNMTSINQFHALFMEKAIPLLASSSKPIVWQEVFDNDVPLPPDTLVQVWKNNPVIEMEKILKAGQKVLFSSSWYLDHLKSGGDWEEFYYDDPRQMVVVNETLESNIVGGEACMWGEVVDDRNVISRVWPRASAVAERLWSAPMPSGYLKQRDIFQQALHRIEEHTCRMIRRGVAAQPPNAPGFCIV